MGAFTDKNGIKRWDLVEENDKVMNLSREDSRVFAEALLNPTEPNEHLKEAAKAHAKLIKDEGGERMSKFKVVKTEILEFERLSDVERAFKVETEYQLCTAEMQLPSVEEELNAKSSAHVSYRIIEQDEDGDPVRSLARSQLTNYLENLDVEQIAELVQKVIEELNLPVEE